MVNVLFHSLPSMVINGVLYILVIGLKLLLLMLLDLLLTPMVVLSEVVNV
jgi:hypothetical protein